MSLNVPNVTTLCIDANSTIVSSFHVMHLKHNYILSQRGSVILLLCKRLNFVDKLEHCAAGDKTVFEYLGLGCDRNMIDDKKLILGIPALVQDLKDRSNLDQVCWKHHRQAVTSLSMLLEQPGTALEELVRLAWLSGFPNYMSNHKQLSQDLYAYFKERHPSAIPVCSACAKASGQAEVCWQPFCAA